MDDTATALWTGIAVISLIYFIKWKTDPLNSIPTVGGYSWPILSIFSAINFSLNSRRLLQEGYKKYYGSVFKVPLLEQWILIVSGPKMVEELRRRPDEELSFAEGVEDSMQIRHTFGPETDEDPYHVDIIREKLTRSIPAILPDVIDELNLAVPERIPAKSDEWLEVAVMPTLQQIIAQISSRVFVGPPLCRNQDYLNLAIAFTIDIIKDRTLVKLAPSFLKPLVGKLSNNVRRTLRQTIPHLKPIIDERWELMEKLGDDWTDKPNDMLQWVIDTSRTRKDNTYEAIARRILLVNFAAIHTSSNTISNVLYHLAERPEYMEPLREEIESIVREEGWTKNAMGRMWKLDSFLRESLRYNGIGLASLTRKALVDVTFPDGTFVPRGSIIMAAANATHHDDSVYADSEVFDPFRFSRMREADGEGTKHQFVNTSLDYIPFGHGKHACPGRFFAANELKSLLAYIILNYDLKLGGDGSRPQNIYWALNVIPAPNGKILFRKREAAV